MNKTVLALFISSLSLGLSGCQSLQQSTTHSQLETKSLVENTSKQTSLSVSANALNQQSFATISHQFIEALWRVTPTWALYNGYHAYDGILTIPNARHRIETLAFVQAQRALFDKLDPKQLSVAEQIDLRLMHNMLDKMAWEIEEFKSWQWDPSNYNVAGGFAQIINEDFAPLDKRLRSALARLENVPVYYQAARSNINRPTLPHTELALQQNKGALTVFDNMEAKLAKSTLNADEKTLFAERLQTAREAVIEHLNWLTQQTKQLQEHGAREFRIGEALYEQKFAMDIQAGMTAKQLYDKALADKVRVQAEMTKLTEQLWSKYMESTMPSDPRQATRQLIDTLSVKHVARDNFVEEVRGQIPELTAFVEQKQLLTLDPNKPLVVRETPEYMRGFAGASISAPGPYEKAANTYYNVTPLDAMSAEQAESYLREYNHWILQILNIHEAIPGHYAQLVYSNESPSLIKSLFGNGAMVEGWAVYTERMMLEEGYGDFEAELWLMYYKWNLRVICNTILDYSIHVLGMTEAQALSLLMDEAYQQRAEAEGKWRRATLSQVQLTSYYAGYRAIYDFREAQKETLGDAFDLKNFHETFLSYGSAPVKDVKQLMNQL